MFLKLCKNDRKTIALAQNLVVNRQSAQEIMRFSHEVADILRSGRLSPHTLTGGLLNWRDGPRARRQGGDAHWWPADSALEPGAGARHETSRGNHRGGNERGVGCGSLGGHEDSESECKSQKARGQGRPARESADNPHRDPHRGNSEQRPGGAVRSRAAQEQGIN